MLDRIRTSFIALPLGPDTLSAGTAKAQWRAPAGFRGRVISAQLSLRSAGATSGSTVVDVNKAPAGANPVTILPAAKLTIAQGAADPFVFSAVDGGKGEPSGVDINGDAGDRVTADVDAIPGTASAGAVVIIEVVRLDI